MRSAVPRWARTAQVALAVLVLGYLVWTVPARSRPQFDTAFDCALPVACYLLIAAVAVAAAVRHRPGWGGRLVVAAVLVRSARSIGTVWFLAVQHRPPVAPSLADAGWVLAVSALVAALLVRLRSSDRARDRW